MKRALLRKNQGFTLIEILIVVVIIGILAAIAVPLFTSQTQNAYTAEGQQNMANVRQACAMYHAQTGDFTGLTYAALNAGTVNLGGTIQDPGTDLVMTIGHFDFTLAPAGATCTITATDTATDTVTVPAAAIPAAVTM